MLPGLGATSLGSLVSAASLNWLGGSKPEGGKRPVPLRGRGRPLLVTVTEYCRQTGEKPDTVRKHIADGSLRAKDLNAKARTGGQKTKPRWRIYASEIDNHHSRRQS